MVNTVTHFAIYSDDIERAKNFYSQVFDWDFQSYGQDDFLQISTGQSGNGGIMGALQSRKYAPIPERMIGMECSVSVEDIDGTIEKIRTSGGQIIMPKTAIPHVGWLTKFLDTEGNLVCAVQYSTSTQ